MSALVHRIESTSPETTRLLHELYARSFYRAADRPAYGRDSAVAAWALDLRKPLSTAALLVPTVDHIIHLLRQNEVSQVAGRGIAAYFLVAGIIARGHGYRGAMIRDSRKPYGFREILEGDIDRRKPVFLVDDILATGATAVAAYHVLRRSAYRPIGLITLFEFGWRKGRDTLRGLGLSTLSLGTLHYRRQRYRKYQKDNL